MSTVNRPLSPHIQVYRWQITMTLSILHRATGIALSVGTILLVAQLLAAAYGPHSFDAVQGFIGSWFGILLLIGWSFSLFYHLCNGIRHLIWDAGYGYDIRSTYITGWTVVGATIVLTAAAWIAAMTVWGNS